MTQNPEIEPGTPAPLSSAEVSDLAALDQGTYSQLRTARNEARLELDGTWHQISPRYVVSQVLQNLIFVAVVLAAALVLALIGSAIVLVVAALVAEQFCTLPKDPDDSEPTDRAGDPGPAEFGGGH